eukprot:3934817-Rhodomonas_salina.1
MQTEARRQTAQTNLQHPRKHTFGRNLPPAYASSAPYRLGRVSSSRKDPHECDDGCARQGCDAQSNGHGGQHTDTMHTTRMPCTRHGRDGNA